MLFKLQKMCSASLDFNEMQIKPQKDTTEHPFE